MSALPDDDHPIGPDGSSTQVFNEDVDYDDRNIPAVFRQAHYAWKHFYKSAVVAPSIGFHVFTGKVTQVFASDSNLSQPYYGQVKTLLEDMGCIQQIQRGGGGAPSIWALLKEPRLEDYEKLDSNKPRRISTGQDVVAQFGVRLASTEQAVRELASAVGLLSEQVRVHLNDHGTETSLIAGDDHEIGITK